MDLAYFTQSLRTNHRDNIYLPNDLLYSCQKLGFGRMATLSSNTPCVLYAFRSSCDGWFRGSLGTFVWFTIHSYRSPSLANAIQECTYYCSSSMDKSRFLPRPFLSESRSIQLVSRVLCDS